jgi:hypothetical protein
VQHSRTEIEVRIVPSDATSSIAAEVVRALAPVLLGMNVTVRTVDAIEPKGRHKVPLVVSHLGDSP